MKKQAISKIGVNMGYFSDLQIEVLDLYASGLSVENISKQTGVIESVVKEIIESDFDYSSLDADIQDPAEYAEYSADLDADYYAKSF